MINAGEPDCHWRNLLIKNQAASGRRRITKIAKENAKLTPSIHLSSFMSASMVANLFSNPAISSAASRALSSGVPAALNASYVLESIIPM